MNAKTNSPDFDVVIVGSGVAGALLAHRLAKSKLHVLILEAGDFAPHRHTIQNNWVTSPLKTADSPFPDPFVAPQPREATGGREHYVENIPKPTPGDPNPIVPFISYYERLVGGSTWHWQGLNIRMLPNDFKLKSTYKLDQSFDWPITYDDLEKWYCEAEHEMGTAGSDEDAKVYADRFKAYRSRPFPMPPLAPSYLDKWFANKLNGKDVKVDSDLPPVPLAVTAVPHAINSKEYDDRPACDGRGTCVPFCPTRARYEASFHIEKARARADCTTAQSRCAKTAHSRATASRPTLKSLYHRLRPRRLLATLLRPNERGAHRKPLRALWSVSLGAAPKAAAIPV